MLEDSIEAANAASREHPCRVIVVLPGDRDAADATARRPDPGRQRRGRGRGRGAATVTARWPSTPAASCMPFLLPDTPVVAWWPDVAPAVPAQDPLGQLAIRRITDATNGADPLACDQEQAGGLHRRRHRSGVEPDHLLAGAADLGAGSGAVRADHSRRWCPACKDEPALDILAGWLASRIDGPVQRAVGDLKVELVRASETITLSRPQDGRDRDADPHRQARTHWFRWRAGRPASAWPRTCGGSTPTRSTSRRSQGIDKVQYVVSASHREVRRHRRTRRRGRRPAGRRHHRGDRRARRTRYVVLTGGGTGIKLLKHVRRARRGDRLVEGPPVLGRRALRARRRRRAQRQAGPRGAARPHRHPGGQRARDARQRRRVRRRHRRRGRWPTSRCWPRTPTTASQHRRSTCTCSAWAVRATSTRCSRTPPRSARPSAHGGRRHRLPQAAAAANHPDAARVQRSREVWLVVAGRRQGRRGRRRGRRGRAPTTCPPRARSARDATVWLLDEAAAGKL